jgi:hypothetical protein
LQAGGAGEQNLLSISNQNLAEGGRETLKIVTVANVTGKDIDERDAGEIEKERKKKELVSRQKNEKRIKRTESLSHTEDVHFTESARDARSFASRCAPEPSS